MPLYGKMVRVACYLAFSCNEAVEPDKADTLRIEELPVPEAQAKQPRGFVTIRTDNSNRKARPFVSFESSRST
jgi:hypothetical protein